MQLITTEFTQVFENLFSHIYIYFFTIKNNFILYTINSMFQNTVFFYNFIFIYQFKWAAGTKGWEPPIERNVAEASSWP